MPATHTPDDHAPPKPAHTPGPWFAVRNSCYWEVNPERNLGDYSVPFTVADCCASAPGDPDGGLMEANARLIAAAPDMLAALQGLLALNDNYAPFGGEFYQDRIDRAWDIARAAIAKSTAQ